MNRIAVALLVLLVGLSLCCAEASAAVEEASWGCLKALYRGAREGVCGGRVPRRDEPVDGYPLRDSPGNALEKLRQAYEAMDADAYLDCLAEDLVFYLHPDDVGAEPWLPDCWGKAEERTIAHHMFADSVSIESVGLSFVHCGEELRAAAPRPGPPVRVVYHENYDLWLHLPSELSFWAHQGSSFLFQVDPDESGPGGEDLWEIVEWYDVDLFQPQPVEPASWSRIKRLFR